MLKCSFVCALLSVAPRTKQMKLTTKTFRRAIGSAALATIVATAASAQSPSWPTPPAPRANARANRALSRRSAGRRPRGRDLSALRRGGRALASRSSERRPQGRPAVRGAAAEVMGPEREVARALPAYPAHAGCEPRMDRAAWRSVPRRPGRPYGRRPAASPSGSSGRQAGHDAARDRAHGTGAHAHRRVDYDRGPESRGRLRPDLRSFIRLRSLALPRFSAVFPRLRWRHYRRVRLDQRPDHRAVRIELSHAAYRDRP